MMTMMYFSLCVYSCVLSGMHSCVLCKGVQHLCSGTHEGQKKVSDPLELELQASDIHTDTQTQLLYKSSKHP